jgi:chromosome segregation ATPase
MDPVNTGLIVSILGALGVGGVIQALIVWLRERKKDAVDVSRTDVDTKLAYLNAVIERLDAEARRSLAERDRLAAELGSEQSRSSALRKRVGELEDELDGVRRSARETQRKCDELAARIRELMNDSGGGDAGPAKV